MSHDVLPQFRLFFRYHAPSRVIGYAWVNDEDSGRAYASQHDACRTFRKMLERGHPPDDWALDVVLPRAAPSVATAATLCPSEHAWRGVRSSRPDERWHIDTTVIRLLDGTRAYLHAVIDNDSRRILAWGVADRSTAANSVAVLLAASGQATSPDGTPDVLADAGVENVNAQVDALVQAGTSADCWR